MDRTPQGGRISRTAPTEPLPQRPPRTRFYATVGCLSVIAGLLLGVGGFFGVRALQDAGVPIAQGEGTTTPDESPQSFDEVPVGPAHAVPFDSTFPVRSTLFDGEAVMTSMVVDWDATAEVQEANSSNEAPADGEKYILLTMEAVYRGDGSFSLLSDTWISVIYVGEDGIQRPRLVLVTPRAEEIFAQWDVADGDTFVSEYVMAVPTDVDGGGEFVLTDSEQDLEEGIWVEGS